MRHGVGEVDAGARLPCGRARLLFLRGWEVRFGFLANPARPPAHTALAGAFRINSPTKAGPPRKTGHHQPAGRRRRRALRVAKRPKPSLLLAYCREHLYEPSKRRLTWPNGSWATIYSDDEPDQVRGFSGDTAWLDEFAKFKNAKPFWDNLQFGMREASADRPRRLITTTPRPLRVLQEIEALPSTVTVTGTSYENQANLDPSWFSDTIAPYAGTRLGRQEITAEYIDDAPGALWQRAMFEVDGFRLQKSCLIFSASSWRSTRRLVPVATLRLPASSSVALASISAATSWRTAPAGCRRVIGRLVASKPTTSGAPIASSPRAIKAARWSPIPSRRCGPTSR